MGKNYGEAARAAKVMQTRNNENFQPIKAEGGWVVGGVHVKNKTPYKRAKALDEIRTLFKDIADSTFEVDMVEYANQIEAESATGKASEVNGQGKGWKLVSSEVMSGRQLQMNNDTSYLVLTVESGNQTLNIQMGGAF